MTQVHIHVSVSQASLHRCLEQKLEIFSEKLFSVRNKSLCVRFYCIPSCRSYSLILHKLLYLPWKNKRLQFPPPVILQSNPIILHHVHLQKYLDINTHPLTWVHPAYLLYRGLIKSYDYGATYWNNQVLVQTLNKAIDCFRLQAHSLSLCS